MKRRATKDCRQRLLLLFLAGVLLGVFGAELGSRLLLSGQSESQRREEREKFQNSAPSPADGLRETGQWERSLALHPFFGYVGRSQSTNANRFGFYSSHQVGYCGDSLCLEEKSVQPPLVVGIFGGSLALQVASDEAAFEKLLAPAFPGRSVKVINFALPGHAMPQAYFIYTYFREFVHVAVFFDGLNEIWNSVDNNRLGFPPVFAKAVHFEVLTAGANSSSDELRLLLQAQHLKRRLQTLTRWSLAPVIRNSALVHLAWKVYRGRVVSKLAAIEPTPSAPFTEMKNSELIRLGVKNWADYHLLADAAVRSRGALALHVLQPNLLFGGKPLTVGEGVRARAFEKLEHLVREGYPLLKNRLEQLAAKGLNVADLSAGFSQESSEIWIDAAHVNERGRDHLQKALAREILLRKAKIRY